VLHARQGLDVIQVRRPDLAVERRALLKHRVEHPGDDGVDAENRLAGHDRVVVDVARRLADDLVVLRILQDHVREIRRGERRGLCRELAVAGRSLRRRVYHAA
jgi:hypothetical protein